MWAKPYSLERRPREVKMGDEEVRCTKDTWDRKEERLCVGCYEGG